MDTEEVDTSNRFFVGANGDEIMFLRVIPPRISKADALNLAAWLVALADMDDEFPSILAAVRDT